MSCQSRHNREQIAVIEGSCGCVVVLFDCHCLYLERGCVYAQVLLGTLPKPQGWKHKAGDDEINDKEDLKVHIDEILLRRPLDIEEMPRETSPPG